MKAFEAGFQAGYEKKANIGKILALTGGAIAVPWAVKKIREVLGKLPPNALTAPGEVSDAMEGDK